MLRGGRIGKGEGIGAGRTWMLTSSILEARASYAARLAILERDEAALLLVASRRPTARSPHHCSLRWRLLTSGGRGRMLLLLLLLLLLRLRVNGKGRVCRRERSPVWICGLKAIGPWR